MRQVPVQRKPCETCPFGGPNPIQLSPKSYERYIMNLVKGIGQHLCHSVGNTHVCRGGRDIQLKALYARGFISEPTDEAFLEAMNRYLG